jgi:hypothetical protein
MVSFGFILAVSLQSEALVEILTWAEEFTVTGQNDDFDTIVDAGEAEEVFDLVGHDVGEGIVLRWAVESADENRCRRWGRGRVVRDFDFCVGEGGVCGGERSGDWLAVRHGCGGLVEEESWSESEWI